MKSAQVHSAFPEKTRADLTCFFLSFDLKQGWIIEIWKKRTCWDGNVMLEMISK